MKARTPLRKPAADPRDDPTRLVNIVTGFRGRPIALIGDLVADEFVHGDIVRISREAPVPILRELRTEIVPGGAGNAVANLRSLGARPFPVGIVGRDEAGRRLLADLRRRGIPVSGILRVAGYATPSKSRILAGGVHTRRQQLVRIDRGQQAGELSRAIRAELGRNLRVALRGAEGLLVADYGYGAATPELLGKTLERLHRRGVPALVDSRARVAHYRLAAACTPNQEEVERALDLPPLADAAVDQAGRKLRTLTGNHAVLVTRGARGMCLFERGKSPVAIPAFGSDEVADVTGAGDTVVATFTLALASGGSFVEAARLANYAAGLVVLKAGTATVGADELIAAIREDHSRA